MNSQPENKAAVAAVTFLAGLGLLSVIAGVSALIWAYSL